MAKEANKEKKENKSFFKDFKAELKRVSWPTFKQLVNNTTAVLSIVLITAVIVFVLDVVFENLNNYGVDKLKLLVKSEEEVTADGEQTPEVSFEVDNTTTGDNSTEAEVESTTPEDIAGDAATENNPSETVDGNTVQ